MLIESFNDPFKEDKTEIDFKRVCYFDTETTGLSPNIAQITEIAAVRDDEEFYEKIELTKETKQLIFDQSKNFVRKDDRDKTIQELLEMANYYDEKAKTTSNEKDALKRFKTFAEASDFLLAHNASFDMKMVNGRLKRYGLETIDKKIPVLDSLAFSRRFFIPLLRSQEDSGSEEAKELLNKLTSKYTQNGKRRYVRSTLSSLSTALFGQIDNWHQALDDVLTTKKIVETAFMFYKKNFDNEKNTDSFKKYYNLNRKFEKQFK